MIPRHAHASSPSLAVVGDEAPRAGPLYRRAESLYLFIAMTRYKNHPIALVTCEREPKLHADEQLLIERFAAAGRAAEVVIWTDATVDWRRFERVIVRSTWDYYQRIVELRAWLAQLEALGTRVVNPLPLLRWNLDKGYLAQLAQRGVPIVPTRFFDAGESVDLAAAAQALGADELILKPAISGSGFRTHRFDAHGAAALQPELDSILATSGALLQPFAREILDEGEWSLLFFGGRFSHAVLKTAAAGEFRIQLQYGGRFHAVTPPATLLRAAEAILAQLPFAAAYARIDGIRRGDDFLLMEVEVFEPYLYLPAEPRAADRFVRACLDA
jgi:glutathione synthase/RimK-type ligase-like ATP-grasp enzyme